MPNAHIDAKFLGDKLMILPDSDMIWA